MKKEERKDSPHAAEPGFGSTHGHRWVWMATAAGFGAFLYLFYQIFAGNPETDRQSWIGLNIGHSLVGILRGQEAKFASHPDQAGVLVLLSIALIALLSLQVLLGRWRLEGILRKRTRDLQESEERYRRVFQASAEGILVVRSDTHAVVEANPQACAILDTARESLLESGWDELRSSGESGRLVQMIAEGSTDREVVQVSTPGGRKLLAEMSLADIQWAGEPHRIVSFRDVTDRVKAQELIRKLSIALEQSPLAIVITDPDGCIEYVNPAFTATTGYALEELMGRNPRILKSGKTPDSVYRDMWSTLVAGRIWHGEFINHRRDRTFYTELATIAPIRDDAGTLMGYVAVKQDVTEKREAETMLREAKSLAESANLAKREFLANMSHEIRTPLNGVISMSALLLETELSESQRRFAGIIRTSGESLLGLINDILDFSKIEAGRLDLDPIDFDLAALFDDVAGILAHRAQSKGLEFLCSVSPEVPCHLHGDPGRLRQILVNLAGNAIKFTATGEVQIRAVLQEDLEDGVVLRFLVRDSGIGIPADKRDLLFKEFGQLDPSIARNYGGTGLGLAISKQLAEKMGGQIGVESPWKSPLDGSMRTGTEFWFTARLGKPNREVVRLLVPAQIKDTRILVVDDNETNCATLVEQLRSWGAQPESVFEGRLALERLREAKDASDPFRVAVLDMKMAGMDGVALAHRIKADPGLKPTPLVLMTSMANRGDGRRMQEVGFAGYLPKPTRQNDLLDILKLVLGAVESDQRVPMITRHTVREHWRSAARILMVEDNRTNQIVAQEVLRKLGLGADMADDGLQALRALETTRYDLVLMDMMMPHLDGIQTTRLIRDPRSAVLDHRIRVVAMTANVGEEDRRRCMEAGMDDYLSKPITPRGLSEVLDRWLAKEKVFERNLAAPIALSPVGNPASEAVFDRKAFLDRVLDDLEVARTVRTVFRQDVPLMVQALEEGLRSKDAPTCRRILHTLRGAANGVGGTELGAFAARWEAEVTPDTLASLHEVIPALHERVQRLVQAMDREL